MQESYAINLGGGTPTSPSWINDIDVRAKLLATLAASISTIAISSIWGQLILFSFSLAYALSMKKVRAVMIVYAVIAAIAVIALGCISVVNIFIPVMKKYSYVSFLIPFLRMATMVNIILPLVFTSRIQSILTALKSLRLALYVYLPVAVMIRFIPTFISDIKQISETVKIRGVKMNFRNLTTKPILMTRLLFMPLLFRSLRTSEELGIAAELKGLGLNDDMKPYKTLVWRKSDTYMMISVMLIASLAVVAEIFTKTTGSIHI